MMRAPRQTPQSARDATDAQLFQAIAGGDLGPLGALFDRHHEDVRQFLLRAAPHDADVDDLVQETFLTASRAAGSFDGRESGRPFLIGVAAQLLRRRRRTFARLRALLDAFGNAPTAAPRTPEESTSQAQDEDRMRAAIAGLSEDKRLVLVMVEYNGLSGVEVAKIIDKPVGTVWRRLHEARAEIRQALERGTR
ncbi:MAG: RNA polymerase sigma factor [Minicystis sp.]